MKYLPLAVVLIASLADAGPKANGIAPDVARFIERRDGCDHFRGEEGYDAARRRELAAQIRKLCSGTDGELAKLKRKHAKNRDLMARLDQYEPAIELRPRR